MNKLYITLILSLFFVVSLAAQFSPDIRRFQGNVKVNNSPRLDVFELDFRENSPTYKEHMELPLGFSGVSYCMADTSGDILFYSNGKQVYDSGLNLVQGTDNLWPNDAFDKNGTQGHNFVVPLSDSIYYMVQSFLFSQQCQYCTDYFFQKIKVDKDTKKVEMLVVDSLFKSSIGNLHGFPTRHGNGRDWLFAIRESDSLSQLDLKYVSYLIEENTIEQLTESNLLPNPFMGGTSGAIGAQKGFSTDGSLYYWYEPGWGAIIYDFDRCTGDMVNPRWVEMPDGDLGPTGVSGAGGLGALISPNNHYLYLSWSPNLYASTVPTSYIFQYDLEDPNFGISAPDTIAISDMLPSPPPFDAVWYNGQLFNTLYYMPDGKIWVNSGANHYSWIEFPDSSGLSCGFKSRAMYVPKQTTHTPMPNYRLGPLDGSPCDTLGINNDPIADFRYEKRDSLRLWFRDLSYHEPTNWSWDFGDGTGSLERFPVHDFPEKKQYNTCLTVSNVNGSHTFCREIDLQDSMKVIASVEPFQEDYGARLFPNPLQKNGQGQLQYRLHNGQYEGFFRIVSLDGQMALRRTLPVHETNYLFSVGNLASGLYFWVVEDGFGMVANGKIFVE